MLVELLSANYTEIRHNPVGAVPAGTMTQINDTFGFPLADVAAGAEGAFIIEAEKVRMVKLAGVTIAEGEAVYWLSAGTDDISNVDGGASDFLMGFSNEDQASASLTIVVKFDGTAEFLKA